MIFSIYDDNDNKGIIIEFDFETGLSLNVNMDDEAAQELIYIIQNKLNARC